MNAFRCVWVGVSLAGLLTVAGCGGMGMSHRAMALSARLAGASEVPPVATAATGSVEASLAPGSQLLRWTVSYTGLSGPLTGAHFHGPAMPGQNAGVVVPITGAMGTPMGSPLSGSATLSASQVADLTAGKWYVNLHTAQHPNGEIRGQVSARR